MGMWRRHERCRVNLDVRLCLDVPVDALHDATGRWSDPNPDHDFDLGPSHKPVSDSDCDPDRGWVASTAERGMQVEGTVCEVRGQEVCDSLTAQIKALWI